MTSYITSSEIRNILILSKTSNIYTVQTTVQMNGQPDGRSDRQTVCLERCQLEKNNVVLIDKQTGNTVDRQ